METCNCKTCEHARMTPVLGYVACAYVFANHKMCYRATLHDLNLDSIETGWGGVYVSWT